MPWIEVEKNKDEEYVPGPKRICPKGKDNPYGSTTGPFNTIGGWGTPASDEDLCPKCKSKKFYYRPGFAEYAENVCDDCGYIEPFAY